MEKLHYNLEKIIKIKIAMDRINSLKYQPEEKLNNIFTLFKDKIIPEHWKRTDKYTREELLSLGYTIDVFNIVFSRPQVTIFLVDDFEHTLTFDTYQEAETWVDDFILKNNLNKNIVQFKR